VFNANTRMLFNLSKIIFVLILFIESIKSCNAQFQLDTGYKFYYFNTVAIDTVNKPFMNIVSIWADSVIQYNDSTNIVVINKSINTSEGQDTCMKLSLASPLGHQIVNNPGKQTLYNQYFEPIIFEVDADSGSYWTAFQDSLLTVYGYMLDTKDTIIFGVNQQLKKIRLLVYKNGVYQYNHMFNSKVFNYADSMGWISFYDLKYFPYKYGNGHHILSGYLNKSTNESTGITHLIKLKDLYSIGDEYHNEQKSISLGSGEVEVINKSGITAIKNIELTDTGFLYTISRRSVTQRVVRIMYSNEPPILDVTTFAMDTIYYHHGVNEFVKLGEDEYAHEFNVSYSACGWYVYYTDISTIHKKNDSCWFTGHSRDSRTKIDFGVPIPHMLTYEFSPSYETLKWIYIKKKNCELGSPLPYNLFVENLNAVDYKKPYPNPTSGLLNFDEKLIGNQLLLYDGVGRLIYTHVIKSQIDISHLQNGYYFYQIMQDGIVVKHGKLIKQ